MDDQRQVGSTPTSGDEEAAAGATERGAVEARLASRERLLAALFDLNPLMMTLVRWPECTVADVNRAFTSLLGYSREEVQGRDGPQIGIWQREEDRDRWLDSLRKHGRVKDLEARLNGKGGQQKDVLFSSEVLDVNDREYVVTVGTDITERLQREAELRDKNAALETANRKLAENERFLRTLFETVADGIFIADEKGTFLEVNPAACEQLGYSREELLGRNVAEVSARPDFKAGNPGEALKAQAQLLYETSHRRRDGSVIPVELSVTMTEHLGERAMLGIARDISSRREEEEARRGLEEKLRQAAKMEAIGRLAGGVAHDFNNLLTAISGFSEVLLEGMSKADPMRADLEEILKASRRAGDLTGQLLAFGRKQMVSPIVLDLNERLQGATRMLERIMGEDITLVFRPSPGLGAVRLDPTQVEQVLVNLAANARDAMPDGGKLLIETQDVVVDEEYSASHPDATEGRYVVLTVSDTGSGMSAEEQEHLFEPFYTTKEVGQGTGLGLATVYGIVRQNGGFLSVYSELGLGSTFRMYFPQVEEPPQAFRAERSSALPRGDETILLVEDEELVRSLASRLLKRQGYQVIAVDSPGDALLLAQRETRKFDLLLTDVVLPHMNGWRLFLELQALRPGLRTLFISGYSEEFVAQRGVLAKGLQFLQKPFSLEALARKVREALDSPPTPPDQGPIDD